MTNQPEPWAEELDNLLGQLGLHTDKAIIRDIELDIHAFIKEVVSVERAEAIEQERKRILAALPKDNPFTKQDEDEARYGFEQALSEVRDIIEPK